MTRAEGERPLPAAVPRHGSRAAAQRGATLLQRLPLAFEPAAHSADAGAFFVRTPAALTRVTRTGVSVTPNGSAAVTIDFVGGRANAIEPLQRVPGYMNDLRGNDPARWRTHVPRYARVRARDVYPGIDVEYYGTGQHLEYDFVLSPGVDPALIRLAIGGSGDTTLTPSGNLATGGERGIVQQRPVAYQEVSGRRIPVEAEYVSGGGGLFSVRVGSYDRRHRLVIDPVIVYSFSAGGSAADSVTDLVVDSAGASYVVGVTWSPDFPVSSAYQGSCSTTCRDGFILKLNPAGTDIEYATYLGGGGQDRLDFIDVDAAANIYVAGTSGSLDFPGASCAECIVITKLSADGSTLLYTHSRSLDPSRGVLVLSDLGVSGDGHAYFLLKTRYWDAEYATVYRLSPLGTSSTAITGRADSALADEIGMAVGPTGDLYFSALTFASHTRPRTIQIERWGADGVRVYATDLESLLAGRIGVSSDGSAFIARPGSNIVRVVSQDGYVQSPVITLPKPARWSTVRGPYFGRDGANGVTATLCGSWLLPTPGSECMASRLNIAGGIRGADLIDAGDAFATDVHGTLYAASGPPDVSVRKYSFLTVDAFGADAPASTPYGTPITWTASMTPPDGFEYGFWRSDAGTWIQAQPYGPANTYTWTPAYSAIGHHDVQVWVRRSGSPHAYEAWAGAAVDIGNAGPPTISTVSLSSEPARVGSPVTFTIAAHGGVPPVEYQYWRLASDGWHLARDYAPSPDYTWTPRVEDVGARAIQVWVRNSGSTAVYETYTHRSFEVAPPVALRLTRLAGPSGSIAAGAPAVWMAEAEGGIAPLEFCFWRLDADAWHLAQDFSPSPSYTWMPGRDDQGAHALQVWARSAGSTAAYEDWSGLMFEVGPAVPPGITALSADTPQRTPGVPITWTTSARDGIAPLQYQFWRFDAVGWQMVRDYDTDPSYTWLPEADDIGQHALQVWVRGAGTTLPYETWAGTGIFHIR